MAISDSTILGKSLNNDYRDNQEAFEQYDFDVDKLQYVCHNFDCPSIEKYKNKYKIDDDMSVEDFIKIIKNHYNELTYIGTENAHLVATSICKNDKKNWDDKKNQKDNGIFLCPNCHKAYDRNGGNFNNIENAQYEWLKKMKSILTSKQKIKDFMEVNSEN